MAMTVSAAEGCLVIDLAVDTSAVLAVLLREPTAETILERLCQAVQPAVAAPTRTEILLVALVKLGEVPATLSSCRPIRSLLYQHGHDKGLIST